MFKKILINILNICLLGIAIYTICFSDVDKLSSLFRYISLIIIIISFFLSHLLKLKKHTKLIRMFYVIFIIYSISMVVYIYLEKYNFLENFYSVNNLKNYIISTGSMGVFIYIILQAMQVVFLPIPAAIICIAGSVIYGPLLGGIYCSIGVLIGSYISFVLGKTFGHRLVKWIVDEANTEKYSQIIRNKGGFFLVLAFLLPMFPDDILCLIAGITDLKYKTFMLIALITRPIGVMCMSYFGGGHIIPFGGWGIYAWIVILVLSIIMMILVYKYQERMQNYILNKVFKKSKSKSKN